MYLLSRSETEQNLVLPFDLITLTTLVPHFINCDGVSLYAGCRATRLIIIFVTATLSYFIEPIWDYRTKCTVQMLEHLK